MFNLKDDSVLCSELVRSFPKDMIKQIEIILSKLNNYNVKGVSAIKGVNEHYNMVFQIEKLYKLIFDYYENTSMSLKFSTKENENILNVKDVTESSDEKLNLIVEVIGETIYKDNLISNTKGRNK